MSGTHIDNSQESLRDEELPVRKKYRLGIVLFVIGCVIIFPTGWLDRKIGFYGDMVSAPVLLLICPLLLGLSALFIRNWMVIIIGALSYVALAKAGFVLLATLFPVRVLSLRVGIGVCGYFIVSAFIVYGIGLYLERCFNYLPVHLRSKCRECGYELRHLTEPRCPECGTPFAPFTKCSVPGDAGDSESEERRNVNS